MEVKEFINWFKRGKEAKKEIKKWNEELTKLYEKLDKYSPKQIVSDRIKSNINHMHTYINEKRIYLLTREIVIIYLMFIILSVIMVFFLFIKPKIIITIDIVLGGFIISFIGLIIIILLKHKLSKPYKEATKKRELAETEYFKAQTEHYQKMKEDAG